MGFGIHVTAWPSCLLTSSCRPVQVRMLEERIAKAGKLQEQREALALQLSLARSREEIVRDALERELAALSALECSMTGAGTHFAEHGHLHHDDNADIWSCQHERCFPGSATGTDLAASNTTIQDMESALEHAQRKLQEAEDDADLQEKAVSAAAARLQR